MKIIDEATILVRSGELISVAVRKTVTPYVATIAPLAGAIWAINPEPPLGLTGQGAFVAPGPDQTVRMTIEMDFLPNPDGSSPPGDRYEIIVSGLPEQETCVVNVFPPGRQSRSFQFLAERQPGRNEL